jgi:nucleotide-binding universal stress UspA family protein
MITRILIATDGHAQSLGALRVGAALAARHGADAEVVAVVEPFPTIGTGGADIGAASWARVSQAAVDGLRSRVEEQLSSVGAEARDWPIHAMVGPPAPIIVRLAESRGADIIVVGLGRHDLADRWFGTEMALRVMRLAHVPVLAVPPDVEMLPAHAVAAMDFTDYSMDAARTAAAVLRPEGDLNLVHVVWEGVHGMPRSGSVDWIDEYRGGVQRRLAALGGELLGPGSDRIHTHVLGGEPARELLRLADQIGADLIAAGSHGTGFIGRVLMGSVSTRLVRGATCSVLVAPPRSVPAELEGRGFDSFPGATAPRDEPVR